MKHYSASGSDFGISVMEHVLTASSICLLRSDKRFPGQEAILNKVSLNLRQGDFHIVLGPNGAGKSTLLKILSGDSKVSSGEVLLDNKPLSSYSLKQLALKRAVLSQRYHFMFPMTVYEVCALGRTPYMGTRLSQDDKRAIDEALTLLELQAHAHKDYSNLSGGEQQRVQIARVLCQETDLLFLDEPLSALDIRHQIKLLDLLKQFSQQGKTILCVMHDINLALRYASHLSFLKQGRVAFQGKAQEINNAAIIESIYGVQVNLLKGEDSIPQIYIKGVQ